MSKYRYREVKNYIHNELKLTKEDIREIMIPIIERRLNEFSIILMEMMFLWTTGFDVWFPMK